MHSFCDPFIKFWFSSAISDDHSGPILSTVVGLLLTAVERYLSLSFGVEQHW